jgi:hypothetical protein
LSRFPYVKTIPILMLEARKRTVLEVVVPGHGRGGLTTSREFSTSSNERFRHSFSKPKNRQKVRVLLVPSLPGSREAIARVSRLGRGRGLQRTEPYSVLRMGVGSGVAIGAFPETWRECGEHGMAEARWYLAGTLKQFTSTFDDVLTDQHCERELGVLFAMSLHESGDHGGKCGKVGDAEVCLSMFNLYEYFHYLELDLGSSNLTFDLRSSIFEPLN